MKKYTPTLFDKLKYQFNEAHLIKENYSQVYQDMFVLTMLNGKRDGYFVEIGASVPVCNNNSYLLETEFGWKGISIDMGVDFELQHKNVRKNIYLNADALSLNYRSIFSENKFPKQIDYLQVDIDKYSLDCLKILPLDEYRFSVITFEHDIYQGNEHIRFKEESRKILKSYGYELIVGSISDGGNPFEDWWVDPKIIDPKLIEMFKTSNDTSNPGDDFLFKKEKEYNNRFIVAITSYNNEKWVSQNIESVLNQTHQNFRIAYYDACSTDKTLALARDYSDKDSRITVTTTPERQIKTWFCERLSEFEDIRDNDVVCVLDGDDFLASEEVLNYLNEVYNKTNCWMTYGGMIVWDGTDTKEPFPQNTEAPFEVKRDKSYRKDLWRYSHFRTFRGFLWKRIKKESWKSVHDNNYITLEDLITMYDCMEMCPADKVFRIDQTVYILNYSTANGGSRGWEENKINGIGQIYESEIRNRPSYPELPIVTPVLAGGLGNQMFEIAAAASLAKDNNALVVINPSEHILPNQGRNVKTYLDNVFSRIATDNTPPFKTTVNNEHIYYTPITYKPNLKIGGHNQSFKYFDHNREYIQNLFGPTDEVLKHIDTKYGLEKTSKVTIVQVRRGDYIRFPDHLPLMPIEYYLTAAKQAAPEEVWVCSDDINWCKENLPFNCPVQYLKDEDYIRMYLMSLCKNVIISNSSFGWWGCYLNKNPDKKVYVPSVWFGKALVDDGFKMDDLILPDWNKI